MNTRNTSLWLFLIGLFSETQIRVVGSIGISELVIFAIAPLVFFMNYRTLKNDKLMPALMWAISAMTGCVIACVYNATPIVYALKGFATVYSVFAIPVVLHALLRKNIMGYRWLLLGIAISGIITIFGFHNAAELSKAVGDATTASTSELKQGELFWLAHFGAWPVLPVQGWYLSTPTPYAIIAPLVLTFYTILVSSSGRSAIVTACLASVLIFLGRKSRKRLARLQRSFFAVALVGVVVLGVLSSLYKYAGQAGWLNERAQNKYEGQMKKDKKGGFSPLKFIMAGRIEFFVGLYECLHAPIIGYGPWAIDTEGVYEDFLSKYGYQEDYEAYLKHQSYLARAYQMRSYALIGGHSHILQFWLGYGILGLPYWIYVLYLIFQFWRRYISFLPQFYGFFVVFSTSFMWNVFFSPFGGRMGFGLFITTLLLIRASAMGRIQLPVQELIRVQKGTY